jgi:NADPH-dependent F420 reductase
MAEPHISVIGGTGDLGSGLCYRWIKAGYNVTIGSRKLDKAEEARARLKAVMPGAEIGAAENAAAAAASDLVVVTVPFDHQASTLDTIRDAVQGKIVVDTTVSLRPPKVGTVQLPPEGSAGMIAQSVLGENVRVVSAFQNVPASELWGDDPVDCDVLVTGNDKAARALVIDLAAAAGLRGLHAGPIQNSAASEAMTSVLITINRQFKSHAGLRITGLD